MRQQKQWPKRIALFELPIFNKTITGIPLVLLGYEIVIALRSSLAIYHLISNAHLWNNC